MTLEVDIDRQIRSCDRLMGNLQATAGLYQSESQNLSDLQTQLETETAARDVLNLVAEEFFDNTLRVIETLVTQGLQKVLKDPSLALELERKISRNKVGVVMTVSSMMKQTKVNTDVLSARGGGLASLVGFFIRLVLMASSGQVRVLVLDESFAHLSVEYESLLAELLHDLSDRMKVQIIMVTHSEVYEEYADTVHRFSLADGITKVQTHKDVWSGD